MTNFLFKADAWLTHREWDYRRHPIVKKVLKRVHGFVFRQMDRDWYKRTDGMCPPDPTFNPVNKKWNNPAW